MTNKKEDTKKQIAELDKRWHDLSCVCWCRDNYLCSACREQDAIKEEIKKLRVHLLYERNKLWN